MHVIFPNIYFKKKIIIKKKSNKIDKEKIKSISRRDNL